MGSQHRNGDCSGISAGSQVGLKSVSHAHPEWRHPRLPARSILDANNCSVYPERNSERLISTRMPRASWRITTSGAGHGGGPSRSALRSRAPCSQAVRELVIWIPARRCNDRKDEDTALAEQFVVSVRAALAERFG